MINLNEEASVKILGKITLELNLNLEEQLNIKNLIDETLYEYEVTTKCTALSTSDIKEKATLYIACKRLDGVSETTLYNYSLFLNKLDLFFNKPLSTITVMDLRMFISFLSKGKQPSTQNTYITKLKTFFTWLQNEEYILKNPTSKLNQTRLPKIRLEPYRPEDVEKLRDACITLRDKALFETMASSACRVGELSGLKIENIDLNLRTIKVFGKGKKERITYISTRAAMYIKEYISKERKGDSEYLFVSQLAPYTRLKERGIEKFVDRLQERSGVQGKVHPHRFRRTQATALLNSGMSIVGVQAILGHESPTTTQRYARLSEENLANEFKRLIK